MISLNEWVSRLLFKQPVQKNYLFNALDAFLSSDYAITRQMLEHCTMFPSNHCQAIFSSMAETGERHIAITRRRDHWDQLRNDLRYKSLYIAIAHALQLTTL